MINWQVTPGKMLTQHEDTLRSFIFQAYSMHSLWPANKTLIVTVGCLIWTFIPSELEIHQAFPHRLPKGSQRMLTIFIYPQHEESSEEETERHNVFRTEHLSTENQDQIRGHW